MIGRTVVSAVASATLAGALLLVGQLPAHADDQLLVSRDGETWTSDLSSPLFDQDRKWVPGDGAQASFWIRNVAATSGTVSITIDASDGDPLIASGFLTFAVRGADTDWIKIDRLGEPHRLRLDLGPHQRSQIFVRARILPGAGNALQRERASLQIQATLTDRSGEPTAPPTEPTAPPTEPPGGPTEPPSDHPDLPNTGAPAGLWLLPLGAAAAGLGGALLRRGRRDRGDPHG